MADDSYNDTIDIIGREKYEERVKELVEAANNFIVEAGFDGTVVCNTRIMNMVVLDYISDIVRLKEFHGIEFVRQEKIWAYTISWLLRRKPLQYVEFTKEESDIFANERFAAFLFMNEVLSEGEYFVEGANSRKYKEYLKLLFYYFKYRACDPQVVELAIESFKMGCKTKKNTL